MRLRGRYQVLSVIGRGSSGTTYEAEDLGEPRPGEPDRPAEPDRSERNARPLRRVAIKELCLRGQGGWQRVELLEREARMLASLDHPGIPRHLESFVVEQDGDVRFYLVQELAPGLSLRMRVQHGWRADPGVAVSIAAEVLQVLDYLHTRPQPVVHRDVAPQNLVHDELTGRVCLVDLGSAAKAEPLEEASSDPLGFTLAGSPGFQAPELMRGRAVAASDLYGLGATLVYLLTGAPPTALPERRLRPHLSAHPALRVLSSGVQRWLSRMLEPAPEDRFASAALALRELRRASGERAPSVAPYDHRPSTGSLAAGAGLMLLGALSGMVALRSLEVAPPAPTRAVAVQAAPVVVPDDAVTSGATWTCGLRCRVELRFSVRRQHRDVQPGSFVMPLVRIEQQGEEEVVNLVGDEDGLRLQTADGSEGIELREGRTYRAVLVSGPLGQHLFIHGRKLTLGPTRGGPTRVQLQSGGTVMVNGWIVRPLRGVRVHQDDVVWNHGRSRWRSHWHQRRSLDLE
jgi:hypothetical protein